MRLLLLNLFLIHVLVAQDATLPTNVLPLLSVDGRGVQIYTCSRQKGELLWVFQAPAATLYNAANEAVGEHSAGPTWKWNDGSAVQGTVVEKQPSPDPGSIPWLLLRASPANKVQGGLTPTTWIRRFATKGGGPPARGCNSSHEQAVARVPYSATYTFYAASR